jgi:serine/threonine-protein kinase
LAQLGKYQLVAEIARGGMGIVSLAVTQGPARFNKLLVVKELKPELVEDTSFLEMFLEEARLAARLSHPNIVQTYEVGAEGKRHFMVMDYLEGVTLSAVLRKKTDAFTLPMHLRVLCETLAALDYAHTLTDFDGTPLGIVHRDATPQNVFVTFDGTVKLVDFGIAKALDTSVETRAGVLKGKPAYMAPEQIAGEVDARADVFSVGVMLWEAIVGRRMWHKKGDIEVLTNIIKGQIPTLRATKPDAPEELIRICDKAIAKSRDERYPTAIALQQDLEAYLTSTKSDVSTREVGKVVATIFAKERATTRSVIEEHIAYLKAGKTTEKVPSLRPEVDDTASSPSNANLDVPRLAEPPSFTNATSPTAAGTPGGTAIPTSVHDALAKDVAANRQKAVIGIGAFVAVALAGSAFALRSPAPVPAAAGPQASTSALAAPTFVVPATHEVSLMVHPPTARISVEGVPISNPGTRTCMHGQHVTMHASAAHHLSADRELTCERDESIEVVLEPEPTPVPSASGAPSAVPPRK